MKKQAAILDDDKIFGELLKEKVECAFEKYRLDFFIDVYNDGEELMNSTMEYELLFMDVVMPGMDGIDFVREWQSIGHKSDIIYVSAYKGEVFRTFGNSTVGFVRKSCLNADLDEAIRLYREKHRERQVVIPEGMRKHFLSADDILYLKSAGHYVEVRMWDKDPLVIHGKLSELASILEKFDFIRIHVRYLVNLRYVESVTKTQVNMKNKEVCRISQRYRREVCGKLSHYCP